MALPLDPDTLLQVVAPKLLRMTAVSLVLGSVVGAGAAAIAALLRRGRRQPLWPVLWGSWLGVFLIGLLPIEANPASLIGGPYGGLWWLAMALVFLPAGAVTGAVLGTLAARAPRRPLRDPRLVGGITLAAYLVGAITLYLGLAAPAITIRTPLATGPWPLLAAISGYEPAPSALALSGDGRQLAVLTVRYGRQQLDLLDLPRRRRHRLRLLHGTSPEQRTLKDVTSSLAFSLDGQELITAAVQQVQVRDLASGRPRLRLDGGSAAYPLADRRLVTLAAVEAWADTPEPHNLKVWDLSSGALLQTIPANLSPTERDPPPIAVSPDRRLLAFPRTPFDDRIQVWAIGETQPQQSLKLSRPAGILSLAFSPDGRQLALALGQGPALSLWDLASAAQIRSLETEQRVQQLHWTDRGLLAGFDGGVRVLDPVSGAVLRTLPMGPTAVSGDGTTLAAYSPGSGIGVWRVGEGTGAAAAQVRGG